MMNRSKWLKRIRFFCGLAGPYDITDHYWFEANRGIENVSPMGRCMKGINNFPFYSPSVIAQELLTKIKAKNMNHLKVNNGLQNDKNEIALNLPYFCLIHSKSDYVVPTSSSIKFQKSLNKLGVGNEYIEYENGTHYDTLFGLCDSKNILFNKLITDISSRLFILCKKFNRNPPPPSPSVTPSMAGISMPAIPEELKNNNNNNNNNNKDQIEEVYEEQEEETVHFKPQKSHNNTQEMNDNAPELKENNSNGNNLSLPRAHSLHIIESKMDDNDNDDDDEEDDDMKKEEIVTKGGEEWEDLSLFNFEDIVPDQDKTDQAVEFMKNLLSDMDKALDAISSLNNTTDGEIEKINDFKQTPQ